MNNFKQFFTKMEFGGLTYRIFKEPSLRKFAFEGEN